MATNNRLENYILFNLFKLPLLIAVAAASLCLLALLVMARNQTSLQVIDKRKALNLEEISRYGAFLGTNALSGKDVKVLLEQHKIQSLQGEDPLQLKVKSIREVEALEKIGMNIASVHSSNATVQVTLDPKILISTQ